MQPIDLVKKKADHLEILLQEIRFEIDQLELKNQHGKYNTMRLLSDEKYRIEVALVESKTLREAADMLNFSERTLYRKMNIYGISAR